MAIFYPTITGSFHSSEGEKQVYKALQTLNDDYVVFHSYRWLGDAKQRRSEGEADFIVLHPTKGILSIEVKAGGIAYRDGSWIQINRLTQSEKRIDPLGQAAESQYRLRGLLRQRYSTQTPLIGRAAWFPSICLPAKLTLPPEAVPEIILDQTSLDTPEQALNRAYTYWQQNVGSRPAPLTRIQFQELVKSLMPSFQIAETVSSSGLEQHVSYVQLTKQQCAILEFLKEQPTAAIHGPAGTGKTLLAVEKARMLARDGKTVLYLCYNEFLLDHLRKQYGHESITFHNVRSLAEEILQDSSLPIAEIIPFFEDYFEHEFDDETWQYPNIVVDEGQDLSDSVLAHLSYLAACQNGQFYIFYDRNQYIMRFEKPEWIEKEAECRLVLYRNCRNTAEIAASISALMGMKKERYVNSVHGLLPQASFYTNSQELQRIASQFVTSMRDQQVPLEDMAILTLRSVPKSMLQGTTTLGDIPIATEPEPGKIWFTSVRKFKGLEARAILLIDVDVSRLPQALTQRLLYVGCSRANTYLRVAFYEDIPKQEYGAIIKALSDEPIKGNRKGIVHLLGMESYTS